jgi:O-acetyl-ADP-ribose deacetylase (regulator of RNase III)
MAPTIEVAQGSLTDGDELVLVNASNTHVTLGSGVSAAIRQACGHEFQRQIEQALREKFGGPMEPGRILVTDAGAHPRAKWVVHVAVMDYRSGARSAAPSLDLIRTGCEKLWDAIETLSEQPLSVAMVALGAGAGGLDFAESMRIGCETLKAHAAIHRDTRIARVAFYAFSPAELRLAQEGVKKVFPEARLRG